MIEGFFENFVLLASNVAFLLPAWSCFSRGRSLSGAAFVFLAIASIFHHLCKWGAYDEMGFGGYCPPGLTHRTMYAVDFFFTHLPVPVVVGFFLNPKTPMMPAHARYRRELAKHVEAIEAIGQKFSTFGDVFQPQTVGKMSRCDGRNAKLVLPRTLEDEDRSSWFLHQKKTVSELLSVSSKEQRSVMIQRVVIPSTPEVRCGSCDAALIWEDERPESRVGARNRFPVTPKKWANLQGSYYVSAPANVVALLYELERAYLIYFAFLAFVAVSLAGPSFVAVTFPLLLSNAIVIAYLFSASYIDAFERKEEVPSQIASSTRGDIARQKVSTFFRSLFSTHSLGDVNVAVSLAWSRDFREVDGTLDFVTNVVPKLSHRRKFYLVLALMLGLGGISLFSSQSHQPKTIYPWTHSLWHLVGGIGMFLLLEFVM